MAVLLWGAHRRRRGNGLGDLRQSVQAGFYRRHPEIIVQGVVGRAAQRRRGRRRKPLEAAPADSGFPWAWLLYRALDCGLTAEAFWDASPRAIYEIYECAKTARKPAGRRGQGKSRAAQAGRHGRSAARAAAEQDSEITKSARAGAFASVFLILRIQRIKEFPRGGIPPCLHPPGENIFCFLHG